MRYLQAQMKPTIKYITITSLLSILLFIITLNNSNYFYNILFADFNKETFVVTNLKTPFYSALKIAGIFFLLPFFCQFVMIKTKMQITWKKAISIFVICLGFMILGFFLRVLLVRLYFAQFTLNYEMVVYPFEKIGFEYYFFGGLIIGSLVSYLVYRKKNK